MNVAFLNARLLFQPMDVDDEVILPERGMSYSCGFSQSQCQGYRSGAWLEFAHNHRPILGVWFYPNLTWFLTTQSKAGFRNPNRLLAVRSRTHDSATSNLSRSTGFHDFTRFAYDLTNWRLIYLYSKTIMAFFLGNTMLKIFTQNFLFILKFVG